ncbi:hypothetical protein BaRGS_00030099 [Batillaria attramentaria]|uniref:Ribosomal protein L4 n=1 Tax=Batillaria attramentaria TaxID=370345 RepID=A0ABD0JV00_9CAEN
MRSAFLNFRSTVYSAVKKSYHEIYNRLGRGSSNRQGLQKQVARRMVTQRRYGKPKVQPLAKENRRVGHGMVPLVHCSKRLLYKSNGKKSFLVHAIDPLHFERLSAQAHTATLPTAVPVLAGLSKSDRITDFKIRTCAFLAEHCLPFSLAPALIDFAKKLAEDPKVLDSLSMNRSTAVYTLTHGVARGFKEELLKSLRTTFFSLNVDEATNNADNKVLDIYFCTIYIKEM